MMASDSFSGQAKTEPVKSINQRARAQIDSGLSNVWLARSNWLRMEQSKCLVTTTTLATTTTV